jgi:TonB-linked SusC/RagA family outer membrane protein
MQSGSNSQKNKTDMKKLCSLVLSLTFLGMAYSQTTISGTVIDELGDPLIGVNIVLQSDNTVGVISDFNGEYSLEVPNTNDSLVFSYIGYEPQTVAIAGRSQIDIKMQPQVNILGDIVVVGYGVQRKSDLTGSISSVEAEELNRVSAGNVEQLLQGRVAGVQVTPSSGAPGTGAIIRIRGTGTLNDASPLFVVDGMLLNDIDFLNPNDIQSLEVLKDASATAIYGSRGANGVIIITTRKGRTQETQVSVDAYYGQQEVVRTIDLTNAADFAQLANEVAINEGRQPTFDDPASFGEGTNWQDVIFQSAPIQSYQVSANGGNENMTFNVSANFFDQQGIIRGSGFERLTARVNNEYKLFEGVKVGHNVSFIRVNRENGPGVLTMAYRAEPVIPVFNEDGSFADATVRIPVGNPEASIFYNNSNTEGNRLVGNLYMDVDFLKHFTFRTNFGFDDDRFQSKSFVPVFEVSPTSLQRNEESGLNVNTGTTKSWLWENTLTYRQEWTNHRVTVLAGITAQEFSFENLGGARRNFLGETEEFFYLSAGEAETQTNFNGGFEWSMLSYLFRVNYVFRDRYLLTASMRADGSSKFGENNRYGYFPSLALGWNLTNEGFMQDIDFLSRMKLRASWGIIGNEKIGAYAGKPTVTSNINTVFGVIEQLQPGASIVDLANPDIRWEETEQTNIGLELGFLNNRLTAELDYYVRTTKDILVAVPIPDYVGSDSNPVVNAATVENSGVDLNLQWRDNIGKVSYNIGAIASTVSNEVLALGDGQEEIFGGGLGVGGKLGTRTVVGLPIGAFYGYITEGVFQNAQELENFPTRGPETPGDLRFRDIDGDGVITTDDRTFIGSPIPDFIYAFNAGFEVAGFDFAIEFNGQSGNKIINAKKMARFGTYNFETSFLDRWTEEGSSNTEPKVTNGGHNYEVSDRFIEDGAFTRLRTPSIRLYPSRNLLDRFGLSKLRVYVIGNNLVTWADYSGYTPEISSGSVISVGIDGGVYPIAKTYTVGLQVGF